MTIKIAPYIFELDTVKFDKVHIATITLKYFREIESKIKNIKDMSANNFCFNLISILGYYKNHEGELTNLSLDEAKQLSDNELELFAKLLVEKSGWQKNELFINEDISICEREKDEKYIDFLKRVYISYLEYHTKVWSKILDPFSSIFSKSKGKEIGELLSKNILLSNNINKQISNSRHILETFNKTNSLDRIPFSLQKPSEKYAMETNITINKVADDLNKVTTLFAQSAELLENMNSIGLHLAGSFKSSIRKSSIYSYIMIGIAVISLLLAAYFSFKTMHYAEKNNDYIDNTAKILFQKIDTYNNNLDSLISLQRNETINIKKQETDLRNNFISTAEDSL